MPSSFAKTSKPNFRATACQTCKVRNNTPVFRCHVGSLSHPGQELGNGPGALDAEKGEGAGVVVPVLVHGLSVLPRQYPGGVGARHVEDAVAEEFRQFVKLRGVVAAAKHLVEDQFCRVFASLIKLIAVPAIIMQER